MLTKNSEERKHTPIVTGVLDYFPLAIAAVARVSFKGNEKHNPGEPLHWSRGKSTDHADCIGRHLADRDAIDEESGELHAAHIAWRALAYLELAEERRAGQSVTTANDGTPKDGDIYRIPDDALGTGAATTPQRYAYDPEATDYIELGKDGAEIVAQDGTRHPTRVPIEQIYRDIANGDLCRVLGKQTRTASNGNASTPPKRYTYDRLAKSYYEISKNRAIYVRKDGQKWEVPYLAHLLADIQKGTLLEVK